MTRTRANCNPPIVLVVCNALDDTTRLHRRIHTDSPAASRKVLQMCHALRRAGLRPYVLSLGRGRADGSSHTFPAKVCRVSGVPTIYAPFSHRHVWSELLSLFGLLASLHRFARYQQRTVIFYNRLPAYLPLLLESSRLEYRCFLDFEDGEVTFGKSLNNYFSRFVQTLFDRYCREGALLACSALKDSTRIRPVHCYYGIANSDIDMPRFQTPSVTCLMSGTLAPDTGAPLLIEAIRRLRERKPDWVSSLSFEITGKGECMEAFERLAAEPGLPQLQVHGRTTDAGYLEILRGCDIGLALKPVGGALADSTFPSKVIEFADLGLLVLSTDISDVRRLLGDGAYYLRRNDPEELINYLAEIVRDRDTASHRARQGRLAVKTQCDPWRSGEDLRDFLFGRAL